MKRILFSFAIIIAALSFTNANAAETKINQEEQKTVSVSTNILSTEAINTLTEDANLKYGCICYVAAESAPYQGVDGSWWVDVTIRCFACD